MARRSEHSQEQIKNMVLDAAQAIITEEGFHALTVRKIALEIGYTVGSIYMVFTNMNDLSTHLKGRTLDELAIVLREIDQSVDVEQQILNLAEGYLYFAAKHFNRWRMIFEAQDNEPLPDWYQQKIEQMFQMVEVLFMQLLPQASVAQSHLAAKALWSGVHGICILSLAGAQHTLDLQASKDAVDLLVNTFIQGWKQLQHQAAAIPPKK